MIGYQFQVTQEEITFGGGQRLVESLRRKAEMEVSLKMLEILKQGRPCAFQLRWTVEEVDRGVHWHSLRVMDYAVDRLSPIFVTDLQSLLRPAPMPQREPVWKRLAGFLAETWRDTADPEKLVANLDRRLNPQIA